MTDFSKSDDELRDELDQAQRNQEVLNRHGFPTAADQQQVVIDGILAELRRRAKAVA